MHSDILSNLIITKVYSATTVYTAKNKKGRKTNRQNWAIIMKYEGETRYTSEGKQYVSDAHNLVVLPKGCSYEWICTSPGHFLGIEFESEGVSKSILAFSVKNSEELFKLFKGMEYKRTAKKPLYEQESIRDAYSIILMLEKATPKKYQPSGKFEKISPAIDYISQNYNRDITNDELALATGLSTVYFRKLFTELVGSSPIAYVHEVRIKKAKEMLKSDYGSIGDIAQSLGYTNIYDFSRVFKKYTGVPPSKY